MPILTDNATVLATGIAAASSYETNHEPYFVIEQHVHLDLKFRAKQVQGATMIKIFQTSDEEPAYVTLDARQCEIDLDRITVNDQKVKATYRDPYEFMDTPKGYTWDARQHHLRASRMKALQPNLRGDFPVAGRETKGCQPANGALRVWLRPERIVLKPIQNSGASGPRGPIDPNTFEISIPFRITRVRDGLHFVGVEDGDTQYPQAYTRHSVERGYASCIFPCVDDRTRVRDWRIHLKFPRTVGDALKHPLASQLARIGPFGRPQPAVPKNQQPYRELDSTEEDKLLDMTAICSGTLVGEHEEKDDVGKGSKKVMVFNPKDCGAQHIGFAVGPFEDVDLYSTFRSEEDEAKLGGNAVKVHGYCLPGRSEEVRNTCQPLAHATDFFTLTFSKYPYEENSYKICFVEEMVEDAVPLQAFSLCSTRLLYPQDIIDTEIEATRKLVLALASQYFGIFITPNELTDTWIVVGLAYFMTDLYLRQLCGNNYYRYQIRTSAEHLTRVDHGRPSLHALGRYLQLGDFEMEFMALKAPLVIFILDRRLLKSSNSAGVVRVISQRLREAMQAADPFAANFVVSSEQFRRACEKKGRLRLESFWDQWILSSGCPRLHISQRFNKKRLEVELTVVQNQVEWAKAKHPLEKGDFWRDFIEERKEVHAAEVPLTFTGPMTFRVHEADGTPYEHCLEMKLDAAATKGSRLAMPYNTKYKRIKRVRQKKRGKDPAKAPGINHVDVEGQDEDGNEEDEKGHTLNMFGDVLMSEEDMASWKLVDWDDDQQQQMDQESYEWIRVDCDFEWIYCLDTNLKVYMTVAQLQQDRDIAAQVESMLQLTRNQPSNIQTTTLLRTLYDDRYFYGIRTMAAHALTGHAEPANNFRGMHHLMRVFRTFYCYPDSANPRPNDFSDKKSYHVQSVIPGAVARIRGGKEFCPEEAREFILDQLVFNNNDENSFSDHFYVAKLLDALATSLVRAKTKDGSVGEDDRKVVSFTERAVAQIERYQQMDEVFSSYQNIWTRTSLDCKVKLMKSGILPVDGIEFMQYLTPETLDLIQIKAFESLIDIGLFVKPGVMKYLLTTMSLASSPFVRDRLFKAFTRGLASIAFGEQDVSELRTAEAGSRPSEAAHGGQSGAGAEGLDLDEEDNGGLIVEQSDAVIRQRQEDAARRADIVAAIKALKEALKDDEALRKGLWKTLDSPVTGVAEKRNMLELCAALFAKEDEMLVTMKFPVRWQATKGPYHRGKSMVMFFKQTYKTRLKRKRDEVVSEDDVQAATTAGQPLVRAEASATYQAPNHEKEQQPKKKMIKLSQTGTSKNATQSPVSILAPVIRQPSTSVATCARAIPEAERSDSISLQNRSTLKVPQGPRQANAKTTLEPARPISSTAAAAKPSKRRKLTETEATTSSSRLSKIVTLYYRKKLTQRQRQQVASLQSTSSTGLHHVDSIVATPAAGAVAGPAAKAVSPPTHGSSPVIVNVSVTSATSSFSANSLTTLQPTQQQPKTPLPNGRPARKPLPTGPSLHSGASPASNTKANTRSCAPPRQSSNSQRASSTSVSHTAGQVASPSPAEAAPKPQKLVKLKLNLNKAKTSFGKSGVTPPPPPPAL